MKLNLQLATPPNWMIKTALLVFITFVFYGGTAFAHTKLIKSDPPNRATINAAPERIQLWFNEEIEGNFATVTLLNADGKPATNNSPEVVSDDLKTVILPIPELAPGKYTVKYRIMSADGHVVESDYSFTLKNNK